MRTMNQTFTLTTLAAALLSLYGPAMAADDAEKAATAPVTADSSQPLQDLPSSDVLDLVKPSSSVSIGAGYLGGDDRRQLGIVGRHGGAIERQQCSGQGGQGKRLIHCAHDHSP